jgi:hypothetical protein
MRFGILVTVVISAGCLVSIPCLALDGNESPQMNTLSAKTAKPGDTLVITGAGLSESRIDEVYLTDHKFDMKVKVLEQKDTYIKVRVPPFAKPGRMQILCLTKGAEPMLLEQPLYVLIKDPSDTSVEEAEPTVEVIEMKPEDLPKPGTPINIPIQAPAPPPVEAKAEPAVAAKKAEAAPQVSLVKKPEAAKAPDQSQGKQ